MKSVRGKLFIQIGMLVLLLVGLMVLANSIFFEPYYTARLKGRLTDYYNKLNTFEESIDEEKLKELIRIEHSANVDILIMSMDDKIVYTSNSYLLDERMKDRLKRLNENAKGEFHPMIIRDGIVNNNGDSKRPPMKVEVLETVNAATKYIKPMVILYSIISC